MGNNRIEIYDTTLRDGSQQPGISFSLHDKMAIAQRLEQFGVSFIELGWPGANEKDSEAFREIKKVPLRNSKIVAFGMTCAKGKNPEGDQQLAKLLAAETEFVAIVGKASKWQVANALCSSLDENLRIIEETCRFLAERGRRVFFDAEHFFDGYNQDSSYSMRCLQAAVDGGASRIVLCDTNGGRLPWEIDTIVRVVKSGQLLPVGIHIHNDSEMAVANSVIAVQAGADQVQVTINGYGERCGNANLCSVVPALALKMGKLCIAQDCVVQLTELSRFTAELANLPLSHGEPYVGQSAFRHKAGLHASAMARNPESYNHIRPELVGNTFSVAVSELSGKSNISIKANEFGISLSKEQVAAVLAQVEALENQGFQFEGAEGSLKLLMLRQTTDYKRRFEILKRNVNSSRHAEANSVDTAIVRVSINNGKNESDLHVADGDGPVNALDNAIRKALLPHFPFIEKLKLVDYKLRALPGKKGTDKAVRILIDFSDGQEEWTTVGCSTDSIEASLQALIDGFEYAILKAFRA